ncbi:MULTISPECIES: DUF1996 domain-containing protein [unclassified Streptomyces]|uniref:DUF1996 domain-containing protein n=1 Tax=unclassified Streptomyces TaxID=2593676 RepID=UPI001BEC9BED|nr:MULTISPECIES: DUF1996 domain-containing protein [unclassified Streptomyces]MBT2403148.1 DUF1996 domain-containing protein [Streptomyces sp. ISL-21]MBT2457549.1 DUF1996 domain-containing protein [Streptomyces sp. ISL-86]MBT2610175.1 DUF1996 domain-containing protein [Streptomyces sp. ISL-87]
MSKKGHKRRLRPSHKALALVSALVLGGGGVVIAAQGASAGQGGRTAPVTATIDCPDVGDRLRDVPDQARTEVDENLAQLDTQIADAYQRLSSGGARSDALLGQLKDERGKTITRLSDAIGQSAARPEGLDGLSACRMKKAPAADPADEVPSGNQTEGIAQNAAQGVAQSGAQQGKGGPARSDFASITSVRPNVRQPAARSGASTGSFAVQCGRNENGHFNPDNVIVAPGVSNGAHHMHDYVGNKTTDAFSTNKSLAASGTTCTNGDQSTYYWPVLRVRDGRAERDANAPGGGKDANVGTILRPKQVTIEFKGSPVSQVAAMPRFLRIITGDAKAFTNGPGNANASWSCTGFENRQLKDKYPVCPKGSDVVRTFTFQSCWDGKNIDSANHRTHVAFAARDGSCKAGFKAIPQLVQRITYAVAPGSRFAVDSFPEQLHKPVTDHGDFINVMSDRLMAGAVRCINGGRACR